MLGYVMIIDGWLWSREIDIGSNDLTYYGRSYMHGLDVFPSVGIWCSTLIEMWTPEDLGISVICLSERISTGYCYMLEQQLLNQITRCVMELDDYGTIGIMSGLCWLWIDLGLMLFTLNDDQ